MSLSFQILILATAPLLFISGSILCKFVMLLDVYILLFPEGTNVHIWQHIHQND